MDEEESKQEGYRKGDKRKIDLKEGMLEFQTQFGRREIEMIEVKKRGTFKNKKAIKKEEILRPGSCKGQ